MRRVRVLSLLSIVLLIGGACKANEEEGGATGAAEANTGKVNVLGAGEPEEMAALQGIADDQITGVDYTVEFESAGNFEQDVQVRGQGGTLDVILLPQPGALPGLVTSADAVSLEDMGYDIGELEATFGTPFMDLGLVDGKHYGIPTNINLKSMIWYPKDDFDKAGYQIPQTWDQLLALSDQIQKDGGTPWCVGFESGGATGWPGTDWVEDIMLDTAGTATYDKWVSHAIPFTDPAVKHAFQLFGDIMFHPGWVLGGADKTPSINFGDAPQPMFQEPPGCWLHRQANFINAFFPSDAVAGTDYSFFPFPKIDQQNTLIGGEYAVVFRNAPEVADFVKKFAGTKVQCDQGANVATSRISPNSGVDPSCYANPILGQASQTVTSALQAGTARFDASDAMPSAVGSGSFWTGIVQYMQQGPSSLDGILENIDKSWPAS